MGQVEERVVGLAASVQQTYHAVRVSTPMCFQIAKAD